MCISGGIYMKENHKILFEPGSIGGVPLRNKFYMSPMGPSGMTDAEGAFKEEAVDYYVARAKGGVGLIITGDCFVENEIQETVMPSHVVPTWRPTCFIRSARRLTERVHAHGAKIFIQLSAGFGRVGHANTLSGEVIAPSPVEHRWVKGLMCREMTVDEIHTYVRRFGEAAEYAKRAGFDGVEIHAIHEGYLLDQFTLSLFNHRTDEYGGSLENRLRFAVEILQEIKKTCGDKFPVGVRYSPKSFIRDLDDKAGGLPGQEFVELGRDMDEGLVVAKMLEDAGYDFLDADVGSYESWHWSHPPMYHEKGLYLPYVSQLKDVVNIPVMCAGRMDNADKSAAALADGKIDFIGLGRPLLADPDYVEKLRRGMLDEIRPCLSCQEGCMGRIQKYGSVCCAVNPQVARELTYGIGKTDSPKHVLVVGGGVAGCESARVLAERGHKVTLLEGSDKLGGNLIPGGAPDFKEDDHALVHWYEHQLDKLDVDVRLNTMADADMVRGYDCDEIIIATGSKPIVPNLGDMSLIKTAEKVLVGESSVGSQIVVVGGGLVGCELALWLKKQDRARDVTIVELLPEILMAGRPTCDANTDMLKALLPFNEIKVNAGTRVVRTESDGVIVRHPDGSESKIPADTIVLAMGYRSNNSLYNELIDTDKPLHLLGDAQKVANIHYAIWNAYEVARGI